MCTCVQDLHCPRLAFCLWTRVRKASRHGGGCRHRVCARVCEKAVVGCVYSEAPAVSSQSAKKGSGKEKKSKTARLTGIFCLPDPVQVYQELLQTVCSMARGFSEYRLLFYKRSTKRVPGGVRVYVHSEFGLERKKRRTVSLRFRRPRRVSAMPTTQKLSSLPRKN